jgi:hypothetical protein
MLAHEVRHPRVDLLPLFVRANGRERGRRDLDPEVEIPERARVRGALRPSAKNRPSSSGFCVAEKADLNRGRSAPRDVERQREVAPACPQDGVDLVPMTVETVERPAASLVSRR